MQQIQNDCVKDTAVGHFELLWPKIPKTQRVPNRH